MEQISAHFGRIVNFGIKDEALPNYSHSQLNVRDEIIYLKLFSIRKAINLPND